MKQSIRIFLIAVLLFGIADVSAGDYSGMFDNDDAALFFGEVISYDETTKEITVIPSEKIKGDVQIGTEQAYTRFLIEASFSEFIIANENFVIETGTIYLMGYSDWDEDGFLYVFNTTSTDAKTLQIIQTYPRGHVFFEEDVQMKLNNGTYERLENERLARLGSVRNENYYLYGAVGAMILVILFFVLRKRK